MTEHTTIAAAAAAAAPLPPPPLARPPSAATVGSSTATPREGSFDNYRVIEQIGSGSFGRVCKIRRVFDNKLLVWKEMNYGKMIEKEKQMLVSEVNILREFRHPHIVRYYDRIIDKDTTQIYIVMEYCEGGDLSQVIRQARRERRYIDENDIWRYFAQILMALGECHKKREGKVLHRDIKPANIFLDKNKDVKLGDFGLARVLGKHSLFARTNVGTPFYMSPEQISELAYNEKSDIWSVGCVLYELAALAPPFEATNQVALAMKIRQGKFARIPSRYSDELFRVISSMLKTEQALRPTVDELMANIHVAVRIKEAKLAQTMYVLKAREAELVRREAAVREREKRMDAIEGITAAAAEPSTLHTVQSAPSLCAAPTSTAAPAPLQRRYSNA